MSCYACGSGFGLFSKEHGCKNCGFAFCGKCLTKKIAIPKLRNEKHHVCNKCFDILSGKTKETDSPARYSPPENFKKRVAALKAREEKGGHSRTSETASPSTDKNKSKYRGLTNSEKEIAERLDKLKEKTPEEAAKYNVTQKEIENRFAKLKGEEPSSSNSPQQHQQKQFYHAPDRRTQQTQVDDLLDEIADEVALDSKLPDPVKEIEARLLKLRGEEQKGNKDEHGNDLNVCNTNNAQPFTQNISKSKGDKSVQSGNNDEISYEEMQKLIEQAAKEAEMDADKAMADLQKDKDIMKKLQEIKSRRKEDINKDQNTGDNAMRDESDTDNENEEELTKNIIKQLLEESRMEEAAARDSVKCNNEETRQEMDSDELPYCSICTEDATLRCHGCDLDLFCKRCWHHCHKEFDMEDHVTSKYIKPKDSG